MTQASRPPNRIRAALREPLLHFLLIGAAIYGLYGWTRPDVEEDPSNRITVTAGEVEWLTGTWQKRWNRAPTPQERAGLIDQYVRETIFYREALAMGLDRDDTIIRRRLAQKLEFLSEDLVATVTPTEAELNAYFAEHAGQYERPERLTITQVFVDPDKREDQTLAAAEAIGAKLRALQPPTEGAEDLGDPFMLPHDYPEHSEAELAKLLGSEFARSVFALETGRWHGPVISGYGVHWVFVEQRMPAETPEFAAVRDRVEQDWRDERRATFNDEFYAQLRARYEVVVEGEVESADPGDTVSRGATATERKAALPNRGASSNPIGSSSDEVAAASGSAR